MIASARLTVPSYVAQSRRRDVQYVTSSRAYAEAARCPVRRARGADSDGLEVLDDVCGRGRVGVGWEVGRWSNARGAMPVRLSRSGLLEWVRG
jgi:hypothetical protein